MNLSTIEQGEELLKKLPEFPLDSRDDLPNSTDYREAISWLWNHASELLQMAREVERMKEEADCMQDEILRLTNSSSQDGRKG